MVKTIYSIERRKERKDRKRDRERKKKTGEESLDSENLIFLIGIYLTNSETGTISMPALINSGIILFNT